MNAKVERVKTQSLHLNTFSSSEEGKKEKVCKNIDNNFSRKK